MKGYTNLAGNSGVTAYEIRRGGIEVRFVDGSEYLYTLESTAPHHIAEMRRRAQGGRGLSTWISQEKPRC